MSTYERSIVSILEPAIKVDEISVEDTESAEAKEAEGNPVPEGTNTKDSSRHGAFLPVVQINSNKFAGDEIIYLSMSLFDRIPKLEVSVEDVDGKFDINFPIDGDVISFYLRPPDSENQKPIRIDFDIETISSDPESKIYSFSGVMKIPGWFREECKSMGENTSFEHLIDICEYLKIGFASNEVGTEDTMRRIIPYATIESFVDDTVKTAYLNDDSFFDWYIDPFYYLCMVNMNKQFSLEDKTEEINISDNAPTSGMHGMEDAEEAIKGSLVLTNKAEMAGKNTFISGFSLVNNTGEVWIGNGYKRYAQWWNIGESESTYEESFVDPLTTPGAEEDFILLKGRVDEDIYENQNKYKYLGKQATVTEGGNVHDNFQFAKILNLQNNQELTKTSLRVELDGMNFYIYKYMRIPVIIYTQGDTKKQLEMENRDDALGENQDNPDPDKVDGFNAASSDNTNPDANPGEDNTSSSPLNQKKNEFLSGYYVVGGIEYIYSAPGPVKQRLTLIRREWPIPAKNKSN